ncbi:MAG TPA: hypothetical protein VMJ32_09630 [Pirellulales bacterium]|nr:hypothetical protein [Pirellulales bacterium]
MWCQNCQQDVPAIAAGDTARCAQCGRFLKRNVYPSSPESAAVEMPNWEIRRNASSNVAAAIPAAMTVQLHRALPAFEQDDWLLDEQLRSLKKRLGLSLKPEAAHSHSVHSAAPIVLRPATLSSTHVPSSAGNHAGKSRRRGSLLAWCLMSLGLMALAGGGAMLAWSFVGRRGDLWGIGMSLTLAGQFGLVLGLVLRLNLLWHANRRTAETLENVDRQLHEINHAAALLRTPQATPGQSFYAHSAEDAAPYPLLSNLKGRLDLFADKLSQLR